MRQETHIQRINQGGRKWPVRFSADIINGETKEFEYRIPENCTLENVYVKFYGSMHLFKVSVEHEEQGTNYPVSVIQFAGSRKSLTGDNEPIDEPVVRPMRYKDKIIVKAENTSGMDATLQVVLSFDSYAAGARVIGGVV